MGSKITTASTVISGYSVAFIVLCWAIERIENGLALDPTKQNWVFMILWFLVAIISATFAISKFLHDNFGRRVALKCFLDKLAEKLSSPNTDLGPEVRKKLLSEVEELTGWVARQVLPKYWYVVLLAADILCVYVGVHFYFDIHVGPAVTGVMFLLGISLVLGGEWALVRCLLFQDKERMTRISKLEKVGEKLGNTALTSGDEAVKIYLGG